MVVIVVWSARLVANYSLFAILPFSHCCIPPSDFLLCMCGQRVHVMHVCW